MSSSMAKFSTWSTMIHTCRFSKGANSANTIVLQRSKERAAPAASAAAAAVTAAVAAAVAAAAAAVAAAATAAAQTVAGQEIHHTVPLTFDLPMS